MINGVAVKSLAGMKILEVRHGSPETPSCGSYGAYELLTDKGTFVLWQSFGQINLSKVVAP